MCDEDIGNELLTYNWEGRGGQGRGAVLYRVSTVGETVLLHTRSGSLSLRSLSKDNHFLVHR